MRARILLLLTAASLTAIQVLPAQGQPAGAWFGLPLPPSMTPHSLPAIIGDRPVVPAVVPPGEEGFTELQGERLIRDLRAIIDFSMQSRESEELGGSQMWGRVSGFPSAELTADWAMQQFRDAGIEDVRAQVLHQDDDATLWLPRQWEVRLVGSPAFGVGTGDVVLSTALPLAPSAIEGGTLTAPVVHVGTGSPAELAHVDVQGMIAVQRVTPQGHMVFERGTVVPRARDLMERGAVAVINIVDLPGNEMARDFSNCGGPCFNLGGRDGRFLETVMNRAANAGVLDEVTMTLSLQAREHRGLQARNVLAVIPGATDETIVLNAHYDAWFDGAGDNADGLAVLMAMARHFARSDVELQRTLVLIASAGHHTPGLHGPRQAVAMNPDLFDNNVLTFNIEHVAQRNFSPARSVFEDGYREFIADSVEAPIVAGITNQAPFLRSLIDDGVRRYGVNFVSGPSTMASGEGSGYRNLGVPVVTAMQASPLYHTTGEVFEVVSEPGLERMARFMRYFVNQVDQAPLHQLQSL